MKSSSLDTQHVAKEIALIIINGSPDSRFVYFPDWSFDQSAYLTAEASGSKNPVLFNPLKDSLSWECVETWMRLYFTDEQFIAYQTEMVKLGCKTPLSQFTATRTIKALAFLRTMNESAWESIRGELETGELTNAALDTKEATNG